MHYEHGQDSAEDFYALHPRQVAVVMVDFQNDFCSPKVFGGADQGYLCR